MPIGPTNPNGKKINLVKLTEDIVAQPMFGDLLRELRLKRELTLREFCRLTGLDPGNVSRYERGKIPAPLQVDTLDRIAAVLGIEPESDEYKEFQSAAYLSAGRLPKGVIDDAELMARLPVFFRTVDGKKLTPEQLDILIEMIKEEL